MWEKLDFESDEESKTNFRKTNNDDVEESKDIVKDLQKEDDENEKKDLVCEEKSEVKGLLEDIKEELANEEKTQNEEIPEELLTTDIVSEDVVQFMNAEQANLQEIGLIMEIISQKVLKRLAFGCQKDMGVMKTAIDTLAKVRQMKTNLINTTFILERVCSVIGVRVKKSVEDLIIQYLPISFWIPKLRINTSRHLQKLSLRYCQLSDAGCGYIFTNFNYNISQVDLTGNNITAKSVIKIVQVLKIQNEKYLIDSSFKGLQYLCLNNNPIKIEGLNFIIDTLLCDFCLKSCELRNCEIESVGEAVLLAVVNTGIEVFDLRSNPIEDVEKINEVTKLIITNNSPNQAMFKWSKAEKLFL